MQTAAAPPLTSAVIGRDFLASIVVFLVALPLCMGIAIASGAPPALGLITGIVGGLVVGSLAGSPLQVSGPAAGMAVLVYQLVQDHGLIMLGVVGLIAGGLQLLAGVLRMGQWFRAISPSVIHGMLAGIGVLIFASQIHVMLDDAPRASGLLNIAAIPEAIVKAIPTDSSVHHLAAMAGIVTILTIVLWNQFKPKRLSLIPGPLLGVIVGTGFAIAASTSPPARLWPGSLIRTSLHSVWSSPLLQAPKPCCAPRRSTRCTSARAPITIRNCARKASAT